MMKDTMMNAKSGSTSKNAARRLLNMAWPSFFFNGVPSAASNGPEASVMGNSLVLFG
jgi:hypothetical protein